MKFTKTLLRFYIFTICFAASLLSIAAESSNLNTNKDTIEITAKRADELIAKLPASDPWEVMPDASTLAWHEAATLEALVDLYEATSDRKYLEEVARRGLRLLSHRDDRRGVVDGSGKSRPAWSMAFKYVVAEGQLVDLSEKPVIAIRSTPFSSNQLTKVEVVITDHKPGRFTLNVSNNHYNRTEKFEDLSLDRNDKRFVEKIVNDPMAPYTAKSGSYTEKSNLIRVNLIKPSTLSPQVITLKPIPLAYMGYLGIIYDPLLRFAEQVKADPKLHQLIPEADQFVQAAEESYADASKRLWRNGPNMDEGYYLTCEKGESFPADNVGAPFNYLAKHVCAELALYRLTGKSEYRNRSEKMIRLFKNRLKYDAKNDLYTWYYWYEPMTTQGWSPEDNLSFNVKYFKPAPNIEDISHGALDIAMVLAAQKKNLIIDDKDVKRFANTLLTNVLLPDYTGVRRKVDGNSDEYPPYFNALHGWLDLTIVDPAIYAAIRKAYLYKGKENLSFSAMLLKWERKLKQ